MVNDARCSELATIVSSCGYSRASHTVRSRTDHTKIIGYTLIWDDDEAGEDLEEFYLVSIKETNYVKVEPEVADDLVDDPNVDDATITEDEGEAKTPT